MKRLFWLGVAVGVGVLVLKHTSVGQQVRSAMAEHEKTLRAALLPDETTLARARETRAAHRATRATTDSEIFPDDGTEYF